MQPDRLAKIELEGARVEALPQVRMLDSHHLRHLNHRKRSVVMPIRPDRKASSTRTRSESGR